MDATGPTLPGASSLPAVDCAHTQMASERSSRIVERVLSDHRPSTLIDRRAFENRLASYMAMGRSIDAAIPLVALARRAGPDIGLHDVVEPAARVPVCLDLFPAVKT